MAKHWDWQSTADVARPALYIAGPGPATVPPTPGDPSADAISDGRRPQPELSVAKVTIRGDFGMRWDGPGPGGGLGGARARGCFVFFEVL